MPGCCASVRKLRTAGVVSVLTSKPQLALPVETQFNGSNDVGRDRRGLEDHELAARLPQRLQALGRFRRDRPFADRAVAARRVRVDSVYTR